MVIQTSPSSPLAGPSRVDDAVPHTSAQRPGTYTSTRRLIASFFLTFAVATGVMARLHALFPTHTSDIAQTLPPGDVRRRTRPPPKFLKVRILTWNMHESVPKVRCHVIYLFTLSLLVTSGRP